MTISFTAINGKEITSVVFTLEQEHFTALHSPENKDITDKWVAGLESGNYHQITGRMTDPSIANSACCLFVLEKECNNKTEEDFTFDALDGNLAAYGSPSAIPDFLTFTLSGRKHPFEQLYAFVEAITEDGKFSSQDTSTPPGWNDTFSLSFLEIAELLKTGTLTLIRDPKNLRPRKVFHSTLYKQD